MRSNRLSALRFALPGLLCLAAGSLSAETIVTLSTSSNSLLGAQPATLQALVTGLPATSNGVTWVCSSTLSGACTTPFGLNHASNAASSSGLASNTYVAPTLISSHGTVTITATASDGTSAQVLIALTPTVVTVTVTASASTVGPGGTVTFTAIVQGTSQTTVNWACSATSGTFSTGALSATYTAPNPIPAAGTVKVTATLAADTTISGSASVTLNAVSVTVSPASATVAPGGSQTFTANVTGGTTGAVTWSLNPAVGSIDQNGTYTAPAVVTAAQKAGVIATSVDDPTKSATATVSLTATGAITVTVSPSTVSLTGGQTQLFTAALTNATNTAVVWSVSPATGAGTIDSFGNYTAPAVITATKATITAQSVQDSTKSGTATVTLSTEIDVGTGAPSSLVSQFQGAYTRNGFPTLTSLPPIGVVKVLGSFSPAAYVQEFYDANKDSGVKYALATGSPTTTGVTSDGTLVTVYQIWSNIYAYYTTVGASTAGLPLSDTQNCPAISGNTCTYQAFDKNYILFAYTTSLPAGSTFYINNPTTTETFYTEWNSLGGLSGAGYPTTATSTSQTAAVVAPATAGSTYLVQTFTSGAIYAITSGTAKGTTHGVIEPFYDVYAAAGGPAGKYGLPTSEIIVFQSGLKQQTFEGGTIAIQPGGTTPVGELPVSTVAISGASVSGTVTLALGNSVTLTATPYDSQGDVEADRAVTWASTNGLVLSIKASGATAVITATGGGSANVTASAGGVTSSKVSFQVTAPCCQIGDGAPSTVQTGFQNAIARDQLSIATPVAAPAQRTGAGYIQMVESGTGTVYMLAEADSAGTAYVVTGALLTAFENQGGPAGTLGYPTSDASTGGTQLFTGGQALAGNPVYLVSGPVLTKWALLKYEAGTAGSPTAAAATFSTFGANSGVAQTFTGGAIYSATAGPLAGQSYFVSGVILSSYTASGGISGSLGMPKSDEFVTAGVHQQIFEGGTVSYSPGSAAQTQLATKIPGVIVAPTSIAAGGTATLAVAGFSNGATIQVTVTGQSAFTVTTATGAYSWSMHIPLSASSQTLAIHAADTKGTATADATLVIRGFDNNRVQLTKIQGDSQTAAPGSLLPIPLEVALLDTSGAPVAGATVQFQPYPGVTLSALTAVTDSAGHAFTSMRLPATTGTAGVTATAANIAQSPVTFYALAQASSLSGFPTAQQSGSGALGNGSATIAQKGSLLTAVANILAYRQARGDVPSPNGSATPAALNQFLISDCTSDGAGHQVCDGFLNNPASSEQIVNLWRAADFTTGLDVVPIAPTVAAIADLVAQGEPVLLSLALSRNGASAGGHFVVANGINIDGSLAIADPNPYFSRTGLNDYLNGFTSGAAWQGTIAAAVRFAVRSPSATRFLMGALSQPASLVASLTLSATSAAGTCGTPAQFLDAVDATGASPVAGPLVSQLTVCDGLQSAYALAVGTNQAYAAFVTDLARSGPSTDLSGSTLVNYQAARPVLNLVLAPLTPSFTASAVVNAATFTAGISPGGLFSIFGIGLSGPSSATSVDFDGVAASILVASPFQINAQVPASVTAGNHVLRVKSAFGTSQQTVAVSAVAPAIFLLGAAASPAIENQDGSVNSASNPLTRGQALIIYATGLGAVTKQGSLSVATATVTAVLNGVEMPVAYAGLAPGYTGLYQVNLVVPASTPPGLGISLTLKQSGQLSNTVFVSLQ